MYNNAKQLDLLASPCRRNVRLRPSTISIPLSAQPIAILPHLYTATSLHAHCASVTLWRGAEQSKALRPLVFLLFFWFSALSSTGSLRVHLPAHRFALPSLHVPATEAVTLQVDQLVILHIVRRVSRPSPPLITREFGFAARGYGV